MGFFNSAVCALALVHLAQACARSDESPAVRLAVTRFFATDTGLVHAKDRAFVYLPWTVAVIGSENDILASMKSAPIKSIGGRISILQSLLNRRMESLALELADTWTLTRDERIRCLCDLRRQPSEDFVRRMLRATPDERGDQDAATAIFRFLGQYDRFVNSPVPDPDFLAIQRHAVNLIPFLEKSLEDDSQDYCVDKEGLVAACCCRAVLDDTEHKERLQALLQRDLSDTEGILDLCSLRGWTLAFEAGCACLPDDAALAMWKKSFSSCLSVSLSLETPISREAEKRQVKLDAWRRSMSLLFTSIAKGKLPGTDSVAAQLANSDEHLIPASLHVCFDASRLLRDAELLRIAVDELDSRIDAGSIRSQTELLGLRVASARAAAALGDHERLAKFTLSCLELFPEAADEPLRDHEWNNAVLPYELELAFANDADPAILRRISDVTVNDERREQRRKLHVLGGLWVLGGGDKGELQRTRKNFSQPTDLEGFVFGMGLVAGSRQSKLSAVQIWILGDNEQLFTNRREIEFFLFGIAAQRQRSWTGLSRIEPDWSERLILALQAKTKTK